MNRSVSSPAKCGALSNLLLILPLIIVAGLHQLGTQAAQTVSASGREACPDVWRVEKVERGLDIEGIMRQHQIPGCDPRLPGRVCEGLWSNGEGRKHTRHTYHTFFGWLDQ